MAKSKTISPFVETATFVCETLELPCNGKLPATAIAEKLSVERPKDKGHGTTISTPTSGHVVKWADLLMFKRHKTDKLPQRIAAMRTEKGGVNGINPLNENIRHIADTLSVWIAKNPESAEIEQKTALRDRLLDLVVDLGGRKSTGTVVSEDEFDLDLDRFDD